MVITADTTKFGSRHHGDIYSIPRPARRAVAAAGKGKAPAVMRGRQIMSCEVRRQKKFASWGASGGACGHLLHLATVASRGSADFTGDFQVPERMDGCGATAKIIRVARRAKRGGGRGRRWEGKAQQRKNARSDQHGNCEARIMANLAVALSAVKQAALLNCLSPKRLRSAWCLDVEKQKRWRGAGGAFQSWREVQDLRVAAPTSYGGRPKIGL